MKYTINIQKQEPVAILSFEGDLTAPYQLEQLKAAIEECVDNGQHYFILDLKKLTYINSSGLNAFIHILTKSRQAGGDTLIAHIPPQLNQLLIMTKLNVIFEVESTVEESLHAISSLVC